MAARVMGRMLIRSPPCRAVFRRRKRILIIADVEIGTTSIVKGDWIWESLDRW